MNNKKKVFIFDIETTGLPKKPNRMDFFTYYPYVQLKHYDYSRIVSICWHVYTNENNGKKTKKINHNYKFIKPVDFKINNSSIACKINKITHELATEKGIPISEVFDLIKKDIEECSVLVAHNILFDRTILLSELFRYGRQDIINLILEKDLYCTMKESKRIMKLRKYPKLIELYKFFHNNEIFDNQHQADSDVEACAKCYFKLININKN